MTRGAVPRDQVTETMLRCELRLPQPFLGLLLALPCVRNAQVSPVLHLRLCLIPPRSWFWHHWVPESEWFPSVRVGDSESRVNIGLGAAGGSELISRDHRCGWKNHKRQLWSSTCVCMIHEAGRRGRRIGAWVILLITETPEPKADVALATETEPPSSWRISGALFSVSTPLDWLVWADLEACWWVNWTGTPVVFAALLQMPSFSLNKWQTTWLQIWS